MAEFNADLEQEAYLAKYARRNYALYIFTIIVSLSGSSFGDMSVFVPSLAMSLHAPSWLVALPMVAGLSIAHAPALLVDWLLGPRTSRAKAYAWSVALMYAPILVLAVFLFRGGMIPGLTPLGLAWLLDRAPHVAMLSILLIAAAAIGLFFVDRRKNDDIPVEKVCPVRAVELWENHG